MGEGAVAQRQEAEGNERALLAQASATATAAIVGRIKAVSTRTIFRSRDSMSRFTGATRAEPGRPQGRAEGREDIL